MAKKVGSTMISLDEWMDQAPRSIRDSVNGQACENIDCPQCPFSSINGAICTSKLKGDSPSWSEYSVFLYKQELLRRKLNLL